MSREILLREWERATFLTHPELADLSLDGHPGARREAEVLTASGRMEILELRQGLEIRTTSFVGRIRLGPATLVVRPKLPDLPLIRLFRYALGLHGHTFDSNVEPTIGLGGLQNLLVRELLEQVRMLESRGLHREYEARREWLASPRGRIDFPAVFAGHLRGEARLPCRHEPRTLDHALNRAVAGGLAAAGAHADDPALRGEVRRLVRSLEAQGIPVLPVTSRSLAEAVRGIDRRTPHYEPVLRLIQLILEDQGLSTEETEPERITVQGFLFDMNRFFQLLLTRLLREHAKDCDLVADQGLRGMMRYQRELNPQRRRAPTPRPDFLITRQCRVIAVLDAKYRDCWGQPPSRDMLHQLALYAVAVGNGQATILYPVTAAGASLQAIRIEDPLAGNPIATVYLQPVNLVELHESLDERIALTNFGHSLMQRSLQSGRSAFTFQGTLDI